MFRLRKYPRYLAGHYPHSPLTAEHQLVITHPDKAKALQLEIETCRIFRRWPRVQVVRQP